jgi:xanthine dehydrogenase YagT iron-sulfur-binding subunit
VATETRVDGEGLATANVERGTASARVTLRVNGTERVLDVEPRVSLLDALREHLELTSGSIGVGV